MMRKLALLMALMGFLLLPASAVADLIPVDVPNNVYQTTTGGQNLAWYLDLSATYNKTYAQQAVFAANLALSVPGVPDNWHLASFAEIVELLGPNSSPYNTTQLEAVWAAIQASPTTLTWTATGRLGEVYPPGPPPSHYIAQINRTIPGNPNVAYGNAAYQDTIFGNHGAWIVTVIPEPTTGLLFASGLIGLAIRGRQRGARGHQTRT